MANKKSLTILNLYSGSLADLMDLFTLNEHTVISKEDFSSETQLDLVILPQGQTIREVKEEFGFKNPKIEFLKFERPASLKDFIIQGGRFVNNSNELNHILLKLLEKHRIQNDMSMHLSDYYDCELHSFTIVNHLMMGTVVDEMSNFVFDQGLDLVSIRSFFDQIIYYIMYLKQSGFSGIPIECEYGIYEGVFVLRMHAMVQNFSIENIIDSFDDNNKNGQVRYLLSAAVNSASFVDISLLDLPNKLCFTGFFEQQGNSKSWGFSFNKIPFASLLSGKENGEKYTDVEGRISSLHSLQNRLENKNIPGGFETFDYDLEDDSILKKHNDGSRPIVDYMLDLYQATYPEMELGQFEQIHFDEFKEKYENQSLIVALTENDQNHIVEQINKNHLVSVYDEARSKIREDDDIRDDLQQVMEDSLADGLSEFLNDDIANNVLSLEEVGKPEGVHDTIFGEFIPSNKNIDAGNSFESMNIGFADPTGVNLAGALDGVEGDFEDTNGEPVGSFDDLIDEEISFGQEELKDELLPVIPAFAQNASDESIRLSNNSIGEEFVTAMKSLAETHDHFTQNLSADFGEEFYEDLLGSSDWQDDETSLKQLVQKTIDSSKKLNRLDQSVKSFIQKEVPEEFKKGVEEYAKAKGEKLSSLTKEELVKFSKENLPDIIGSILKDDGQIASYKEELENYFIAGQEDELDHTGLTEFQKKFKLRLEKKLKHSVELVKIGEVHQLPQGEMNSEASQIAVKETMREVFAEEFSFENASTQEIEGKENKLVRELSSTLSIPEDKVREIVKGAIETTKEAELEFVSKNITEEESWKVQSGNNESSENNEMHLNSSSNYELENELNRIKSENQLLKTNLSVLELRLGTNSESKDQFDFVMSDSELAGEDSFAREQQEGLISNLKNGSQIEEDDIMKLDRSITREAELRESMKSLITDLKKSEIESEKKDLVLKHEMHKVSKVLKAKDLVLEKAKESVRISMEKQEKQMIALKKQVGHLTEEAKLSENKPGIVRRDDVEVVLGNEVKNLKKSKEALERRIESEIDAHDDTEEKYQESNKVAMDSKKRLLTIESELKISQSQLKLLKEQNTNLVLSADSSNGLKADKLEKENDLLKEQISTLQSKVAAPVKGAPTIEDMEGIKGRNNQLQVKVKELVEKLKRAEKASGATAGGQGGGTAKEKHLEKSMQKAATEVTKLRSDFAEKKKEAMKYKTELTGLKNKMTVMKRDLDRANKHAASARIKKKAA